MAPILQEIEFVNHPYGRRTQHSITIPRSIAEGHGLDQGDTVHISPRPRGFALKKGHTDGATQITVIRAKTRVYRGRPYYTTRIYIPEEMVRSAGFTKKDEFEFSTDGQTITARRKR